MPDADLGLPPMVKRTGPSFKRGLIKTLLFVGITLLVLNPNLKRAWLQVGHTLQPEALIQTNFTALPLINGQIDRVVAADGGRHSEARLVAKFVLRKIHYVSDYENWGNLDYWPTATEVWDRGQEDCDGRAVLAASILRSRGYRSASLVVGLDHMWIRVNENETDPTKPAHFVALLSPNREFSLRLHSKSRWQDFVILAKAFIQPTAFRDTSTHLFADVPPFRKAILITVFLLLWAYPCRNRTGLLLVIALGLAAANFLADWEPGKGPLLHASLGAMLLLLSWAGAIFLNWLARHPSTVQAQEQPARS